LKGELAPRRSVATRNDSPPPSTVVRRGCFCLVSVEGVEIHKSRATLADGRALRDCPEKSCGWELTFGAGAGFIRPVCNVLLFARGN